MWRVIDSTAHVLYCPTMLGRRGAHTRWHHRIHLIPGPWLGWVCDRYDRWLGVTPDELRRTHMISKSSTLKEIRVVDSARVIVEVQAGLIPGTPDQEHSRQWVISSETWYGMQDDPGKQSEALATLNGQAIGYAAFLMLQPDRFNWVRTDWLWL